jgi:aspartate aminotransferase-like enzyme
MTLPINLSTGPVAVSAEVMKALSVPPISHRSAAFRQLYEKTTGMLCSNFQVKETFLLTGSGTMANECMLQEIKAIGGSGLILSNGEFGSRLMNQARRNNISHLPYQLAWGERFDIAEIAALISNHSIQWVLFCHCETSTGVINDLASLAALCRSNNCSCFVDCMSTVGTISLDLSGVTMATASSGKGLASIPGLGIIFSNTSPQIKVSSPVYLDLACYKDSGGIPFTLSSNLLHALCIAIQQKMTTQQFHLAGLLAEKIYSALAEKKLVPFASKDSRVFTMVPGNKYDIHFLNSLQEKLVLSYESDYLKKRRWQQLAVFGCYSVKEVEDVERFLREGVQSSYAGNSFLQAS